MTPLNKIFKKYTTTLRFMVSKLAKLSNEEKYEACNTYKLEIDSYVIRQCKIIICNDHLIVYENGDSLYTAVLDLLGIYFVLTQQILFGNKIVELEHIDKMEMCLFTRPLLKEVNDYYEEQIIEIEL